MAGRGMPTGPKGAAVLVMVVLGAAMAGSSALDAIPYGLNDIEPTCLDGLNQPDNIYSQDPGFDFDAVNPSEYCLIYPFKDGGGERFTDPSAQGNHPGGYSVTVWDVAYEELVVKNGGDVCTLADYYVNQAYAMPGSGHWYETDGTIAQAQAVYLTCPPPPP